MGQHKDAQRSRNATLQQIWTAYLDGRDLLHRNELIVAYQPVVRLTVQRLPANILSYWQTDELRSFGQDGLMRAITRWSDPDLAKFEQYAQRCIRGAIFDELRRLDWMPRSLRRRIIAYKAAFEVLLDDLGRTPQPQEVCRAMGLTDRQAEELQKALTASQLLHLEGRSSQPVNAGSLADLLVDEGAGPETKAMAAADVDALIQAAATLGEREHKVIMLAFYGELTQDQIGKIIGVGGPQVSKIQSAALRKLRMRMNAERADVTDRASAERTAPRVTRAAALADARS